MSEPLVIHQQFDYPDRTYFHVYHVMMGEGLLPDVLPHWHSELEITLISGADIHYINGQRIEVPAGALVVVNANAVHKIEAVPIENPPADRVLARVLVVQEEVVNALLPTYGEYEFAPLRTHVAPEIRAIFDVLDDYGEREETYERDGHTGICPVGEKTDSEDPYGYLNRLALLSRLLYLLCRDGYTPADRQGSVNHDKNMERLKGVIQYIEGHYSEKIREDEVAEKFYFTPTYFSRFFKKATGMTFKRFVINYRVNRARDLLRDTDLTATDIALQTGFADSRMLSLAFKDVFDVSPTQFRKGARSAKN